MGTFSKKAGGSFPSISQGRICDYLRKVSFEEIGIDSAIDCSLFQKLDGMYNGDLIFKKFKTSELNSTVRCFEWLDYELQKNGIAIENYDRSASRDPMEFRFKHNSINPVIYSILTNGSLAMPDFSFIREKIDNFHSFNKLSFYEVSPFCFDGELTELALQGSVYEKWSVDTISTKALAIEFVNEIFEGRFNDFKIYRTQDDWGVAHLHLFIAYFLFDCRNGELLILSKNDWT